MTWYAFAILFGYAVAAALAWRVPRAPFWAASSAAVFYTSWLWWAYGLPAGVLFGGSLNLAMCFALYALAGARWELRLWNAYHLMLVIDILYLAGAATHFQFAIALELANWLAIAIISAAGILERTGHGHTGAHPAHGWLAALRLALYAKRSRPPFWKVP